MVQRIDGRSSTSVSQGVLMKQQGIYTRVDPHPSLLGSSKDDANVAGDGTGSHWKDLWGCFSSPAFR